MVNWRKIGQVSAIFYTILYAAAVLTPRKRSSHEGTLKNSHFFKRIIHEILYYGGALEPVANVLFLIPIFAFLILFLGGSKAHCWLAICVTLSAIIEILQRYIPGRVSSLQDLLLNCLGTVSAFLLYKIALKSNFLK
jgi:glycopeptide antibiotics resistance protein